MSSFDVFILLLVAAQNGVIIYLCFERDSMFKKIKELEMKCDHHHYPKSLHDLQRLERVTVH